MQEQQTAITSSYETINTLEALHVDFMDIAHELHQQQSESKKINKAKRRSQARRAIEAHQEKKRLEAELKEWWEEA